MKKLLIVCCLALFTLAARPSSAQAAAAAPAHKIRVLILTGSSDWSHPWQGTAPFMQGILNNTGRFDAKLEEEVAGITSATLANYDVLVDYYYGPRWPAVTEKAVEDFIRSGKGMVGSSRDHLWALLRPGRRKRHRASPAGRRTLGCVR